MKKVLLIIISLLSLTLYGQNNLSEDSLSIHPKIVHSISVNTCIDYVASSIGDDIREEIPLKDKIKVNTSIPINLKYSFSFNNNEIKHYLPGGYQGIGIGVLNLGAAQKDGLHKSLDNIGYPILAYVFQGGPFYNFNNNVYLNYEWNFGAAIGWKPYSEANKNFNLTVGSRVNAYLHLGIDLRWKYNDYLEFLAGISASHFSNGNTSFPNPGINAFGLRVGLNMVINPPAKGFVPVKHDSLIKKKVEYNLSLWGSARKRVFRGLEKPVLLPGRYAVAGISFSPMFRLNSWWSVGGALDLEYDKSSNLKRYYISGQTTNDIRFSDPSFLRQISLGISAHGELRMPIFAVNIGCGVNLMAPPENRGSYQNITLKTYLCENFYLNIGYQLRNFYRQSSLMIGVGLTI